MRTPAAMPYLSGRASLGRLRALGCALLLLLAGTTARAQHLVATTLPWGDALRALAVDPGTHQVFVLDPQLGVVAVSDLGNPLGPMTLVPVGAGPRAIGLDPATHRVYIANAGDGTVTVVNGLDPDAQPLTVPVGAQPGAIVVDPGLHKAFVANAGAGTVSVLDGQDPAAAAVRVAVGQGPSALALDPVSHRVYVANTSDGTVSVLDGANPAGTPVRTVRVGADPVALAVNPVTQRIFVANQGDGTLAVLDGNDPTGLPVRVPVGTHPAALAVNPVTDQIYVLYDQANSVASAVAVFDGTDLSTAATPVLVGRNPAGLAVDTLTNRVYVANHGDASVTVIDGDHPGSTSTVGLGGHPYAVAVNPVTDRVCVSLDAAVAVLDGADPVLTAAATVGTPAGIALNPVTGLVYVSNGGGASVSVLARVSQPDIPVGNAPQGVAVNPLSHQLFVANSRDNTVSVIDLAQPASATATVPVGRQPLDLAVNPVTNQVYVAQGGGNVSVIDGDHPDATPRTVATASPVRQIAVNPVTNRIYFTCTSGTVAMLDGANPGLPATPVTLPGARAVAAFAVAVNPVTDQVFVTDTANACVWVFAGRPDPATTVSVPVGGQPCSLALNPVSDQIYVGNAADGTVSVLDGRDPGAGAITVPVGSEPMAVAVNPLTNRIYVVNQGGPSVTVLDGEAPRATPVTLGLASGQAGLVALDPGLDRVYVPGNSDQVSVLAEPATLAVPMTLSPAGVVDALSDPARSSAGLFATMNHAPAFTVAVTSDYADATPYGPMSGLGNPPPTALYYWVDDGASPVWSRAAAGAAGRFSLELGGQCLGLHSLYLFAGYGAEGGTASTAVGTGNAPELSNLTATHFFVLATPTTTALSQDINPQLAGGRVTFTATVAANQTVAATPTGTVTFYDGKALLGTGTLALQAGALVARFQTTGLAAGSHAISAIYSGDATFGASTGHATQLIAGVAASLTAVSGGGQSARVGVIYTAPLVVRVLDANHIPVPKVLVTFTGAGLLYSSTTAKTDANGQASVMAMPAKGPAGTARTAIASAGTLTASFPETVTAGPAVSLAAVSGGGQKALLGAAYAAHLVVRALDANGIPVSGAPVGFAGTGLVLAPARVVTDAYGLASVTATPSKGPASDTRTVTASLAGHTVTFTESVTPGAAASITVVSGAGQTAPIGTAYAAKLVAEVKDANGTLVPGTQVAFTGPGLLFAPFVAVTGDDGLAYATATPIKEQASAAQIVMATSTKGAASATRIATASIQVAGVTFAESVTPGAVARITAFSGGSQTAKGGDFYASNLVAQVEDANGIPVRDTRVVFTGPGLEMAPYGVTDANGLAGTRARAIAGPASTVRTATASVAGHTATFAETVTPGAAAGLIVVSGGGQTAPVGTAYAEPLVVRVVDQYNVPVPHGVVAFGGHDLRFAGPASVRAADGLVSVTATPTAGAASAARTAVARLVSTSVTVTIAERVTPGAAASLAVVSGAGQSALVGQAYAAPLVVRVVDAYNIPVPHAPVTFSGTALGFSALTLDTDAGGLASVQITPTPAGASPERTGSASAAGHTVTFTERVTFASVLTAVSGGGQSAAVGEAYAEPLEVRVLDTNGTPVPGVVVSFSGTGLRFAESTATTDAQGLARVTVFAAAGVLGKTRTAMARVSGGQFVVFTEQVL